MPLDFLASVVLVFLIHCFVIQMQCASDLGLRFVRFDIIIILLRIVPYTLAQTLAELVVLALLGRRRFHNTIDVERNLLGFSSSFDFLVSKDSFQLLLPGTDIYLIAAFDHF